MNAFRRELLDLVGCTDYIATFADPSRKIIDIDNYTYTIDGDVLPANITQAAAQSFITAMAGDNDFVLTYISGFARAATYPYGATTMIVNPALLVQITDQSSGKNFFNAPSPMPAIAGQGGFPFLLASPRVLRARTSLKTTAISAQNVAFNGFYLCFSGSRIWYG